MNDPGTASLELSPTLWRTCRALANRGRLALLRCVWDHPAESVSRLARLTGQSLPRASQSLRSLNARGLLAVERVGSAVYYRLEADPAVAEATDLVAALRQELRRGRRPADRLFAALTALTHPRRVRLVYVLGREPLLGVTALRRRTGMSADALHRHLNKLMRRGWIGRTKGRYRLLQQPGVLPRVLIRLARRRPA